MLAELTKKASLQQLYVFGHFTAGEIQELKLDGWQEVKPPVKRLKKGSQHNKNGIPIGRVV